MTDRDSPRRARTPASEERGVSDVLAFVFVFSIIVTSVGLVSAVGFTVLEDLQQSEQAVNAVRGMESLSQNIGEIQRGHAPGRTGELKLNNGVVFVRETAGMTVTVAGGPACSASSPPSVCASASDPGQQFDMGTFYYALSDTKTNVSYEGGAVFREDRGGRPVLIDGPRLICNEDRGFAVVSVVTLTSDAGAPGGEGAVQVVARENESRLYFANRSVDRVEIDVTDSRFEDGWERYFTQASGWSYSGGTATCNPSDPMRVFVRRTVVNIDFVT